ncbi:MAG: ClpXP protease specificity-enhancing factor [Pseudomonadota bacterium]|nr:ClpXP protease specificity-enhancing factor [Pseudomonadota bacterium]MEC7418551.1 ClpXP protease specificity-enhancing factor [Pseudomonadota bacterium]MEC7553343.1 ClpXP protease specificity-enhancing factor [Pseudomonadota bacterium]MEC8072352.1 ClpXP protease specificity-enhancing factor [Pseudomonadota bacterium]
MKPRRPYLLRALYEWILDSDEVPNILVDTEVAGVIVPTEYVQDGQIVLNISPTAVKDLSLGNDYVMCFGRFSGRNFEIVLPIESIRAIYCRDSGQGLAFEDEAFDTPSEDKAVTEPSKSDGREKPEDKNGSGPTLRLV